MDDNQDERAPGPEYFISHAVGVLNRVIAEAAMKGHEVKLSIRSFPGVGIIKKCPQVHALVTKP